MTRKLVAFKPSVPSPEIASARLRCYLPVRYLQHAGRDCEVFQPARCHEYRAVIFQKTYGPEDQELARALRARGARVCFDLCDNHFHAPDDRPDLRGRADQLRRMLDLCDVISVSTPELGRCIPRPTQVIDDVLDEVRADWDRPLRAAARLLDRWRKRRLRLVWFGTTGMESPPYGIIDLARLVPVLDELNESVPLQLTVISNSFDSYHHHLRGARFPSRYLEFRTRTFQRHFRRHDVCLIPVNSNPFTLCKTVNRPALSLLLGVSVVADAIPSYEELRPYVCFGSWREHLARHAADPSLRARQVREGQQYLKTRYSEEHVVRQWGTLLDTLAA